MPVFVSRMYLACLLTPFRFLMGASCGGDTKPEEEPAYIAVGLQTHHAYSVLDVKDVHGIRYLEASTVLVV